MVSIKGRLAETAIMPPQCLVRTAVWLPFREHVGDGALHSWGCAALTSGYGIARLRRAVG